MSGSNYEPNPASTIGKCGACGYAPIEVKEYERFGYSGRVSGDDRNAPMRFKKLCALCATTTVGETVDIYQSMGHPAYENAKVRQQVNFVANMIFAALHSLGASSAESTEAQLSQVTATLLEREEEITRLKQQLAARGVVKC